MDRWACVDAVRFPLQVLLSRRPQWADHPVAVVDRDGPRARLQVLNDRARSAGLDRQMTVGDATGMVPRLRVDTVDASALEDRTTRMAATLEAFTPRVERDDDQTGLVWLQASGLGDLYGGFDEWIDAIKQTLRTDCDLFVAIVVGFSRFGTFAVARSTGRSGIFETPDSERRSARSVPLARLELRESVLETTRSLGVETVDDLLALPAEGVRRRLGETAFRWYRRARGDLDRPRPGFRPPDNASRTEHLECAETNRDRLLFLIKRRLQELLDDLDSERDRIAALKLTLHRDGDAPLETDVQPAEPTCDTGLLADLIRLRLEMLPVATGITDLTLEIQQQTASTEQLHLFAAEPTRDIDAANQALARLRAEFGDETVLTVAPAEGHLPESRFELQRLDELQLPETDPGEDRPAIRRFFPAPIQLSTRPDTPTCAGPHVVDGGWWVRPTRRDYHFADTDHRLLWIFYDHQRDRWYIHGEY